MTATVKVISQLQTGTFRGKIGHRRQYEIMCDYSAFYFANFPVEKKKAVEKPCSVCIAAACSAVSDYI